MSDRPQTAEEFLGPRENYPQPKQTAEEFLGPRQAYESPLQGPDWDSFFRTGAPGSMLDLFNQGYKQAWGQEPLGIERKLNPDAPPDAPEHDKTVADWLRDQGVLPDARKNNSNIVRRFNEWLLRGTAYLADAGMRSVYSTARGAAATAGAGGPLGAVVAPIGAVASSLLETGGMPEVVHPFTGEHPQAVIDHALNAGVLADDRTPPATATKGEPGANEIVLDSRPDYPDPAAMARTNITDRLNQIDTRLAQSPQMPERQALVAERAELQSQLDKIPDTPPPAEDANTKARALDPENFAILDDLHAKRQALQEMLAEQLTVPSYNIGGVEVPGTARLQDLIRETQAAEAAPTGQLAAKASTAEYLRSQIRDLDQQIADASKKVEQAYRDAQPVVTYEFQPTMQADIGITADEPPLPRTPEAAPAREIQNLAQRRPTIAQEVFRDLVGVGRPEPEARAAGALVQAHYEARAARFDGKLGTARDLYDADAPSIRSAEGRNRGALSLADNAITLFKSADASTFIHETAHGWFEELLADAKRENAPQDLIDDVNTVKAWLQMQADRPTLAQHERFARGFERYMMEGVAPNGRLANIFAKFRDWLVRLYQTVSRLRAPITDDIRGVYDRLLATPRTEIVEAPERPVSANFADVHEADLRTATPENAIERADAIRAERDTVGATLRNEINLGRARARAAARSKAEVGGGAGGTPVPEPSPGGIRFESDGGGPTPEAQAVGAGGTPAAAQGVEPEQVRRPTQEFGEPRRLTDKAGNIRLDNLNAPEDVEAAIRESARINEGYGAERRGIVTDAQILDLATALGKDPIFLDKKAIGEAFNAEEIFAARLLLRQTEADVRAAMQRVNQGGDPLELAQAIARNRMVQGKVAQATAEWGRAGRAFHALSNFVGSPDALSVFLKENKEDFGNSYDQLLQMARQGQYLQGPGQINNFVRSPYGARGPILMYYYNSLLSGPITHTVYAIGNELRAIADPVYAATGAGIARLRQLFGGSEADAVKLREASASMWAFVDGSMKGWRAAYDAFRSGQQVVLPGLQGYANVFGNPVGAPPAPATGLGRVLGAVHANNLPYRSIAAIHSYGVSLRYYQNLARYAVRQAMAEGLTGTALERRIAELQTTPPDHLAQAAFSNSGRIMEDTPQSVQEWAELAKRASEEAMTQMYMRQYDYHSWQASALRAIHGTRVGAALVPFAKVGMEITREDFLRHTPAGFALDKEVRNQLLLREGGAAFDEAMARQAIGMGLIGTGVGLTAMALSTGYGPPDPEHRLAWIGAGNVPYSINVGGLKIPMKGLPVLGNLLMFGADMYETAHYWDGKEIGKVATNYLKAAGRWALSEGLFRDIAELGDVINDPARHIGPYILNFAAGWLPWSSMTNQMNRFLIDPYSKDVHGFDFTAALDTVRSRIPGLSWGVPDRIDMFGNPVRNRGAGPITLRNGWQVAAEYANDPVANKLADINVSISDMPRKIEGVDLTTREYEHLKVVAGKLTHQMLQGYVTNPGFDRMPLGIRQLTVHQVVEQARKMARAQVIAESVRANPSDNLLTKATQKRMEILQSGR